MTGKMLNKGYGIMPNEILYNNEISSSAKVFFVCVASHMAEKGYCFASNNYLAERLSVKPRQIQRWLEDLAGYLFIQEIKGKRQICFYPDDAEKWGCQKRRGGVSKKTPIII